LAAPFIDIINSRTKTGVSVYAHVLMATQAAVAINSTLFIITRLPNSTRVRFWLRALFTEKNRRKKRRLTIKRVPLKIRRLRTLLKINFEQG
jgi:hypothetical protein